MGRHRSYSPRRRSRSRTPPRSRREHRSHRRSPPPSGLLVRNVALDTRPEDLRIPFEKFGPLKDVYLPRDYYTGQPRGFGFVKFRYPEDAAKAKDRLNHTIVGGREIRIVYAEENRKTPREMRKSGHTSVRYEGRRRTPTRSPRRQYNSYSRSPVTRRRGSRSISRSPSHRNERYYTSARSHSPLIERNRSTRAQMPLGERDYRSNRRSLSPKEDSLSDDKEYKRGVKSLNLGAISPRDGKRYRSSQRSHSPRSPHDEGYQSSRRPRRSREISPHDGKGLKSPKTSVSPLRESPLGDDSSSDERENWRGVRSANLRNIKSHDGNSFKSSQRPPSPRETGLRDISLKNGEDLRSPGRSSSPREEAMLGGDCKSSHDFCTLRKVSPHIDE